MSKKKMTLSICFSLFLLSSAFAPCTFAASVETDGDLKVNGQIWSTSGGFKFPDGTELSAAGLNGLIFNVGFVVDDSNSNAGSLLSGAIKFGAGSTGEGIASQRTAGVGQNGLDFYTQFLSRLTITNTGSVGIGTRAPAYLLDVAGNIHASTALSAASLVVTGSARADYGNFETTGLGYYAVKGRSTGTGATRGVEGEVSSATGMGGKFINTSLTGKAISAVVGAAEVMNADAAGIHAGPGMTGTPLAYGAFNSDGSKASGSANLSCVWNTTSTRYDLTIADNSYTPNTHVVVVTPSNSSLPLFATTSWDGGSTLIVRVFDSTFTSVQRQFHVVVYKP